MSTSASLGVVWAALEERFKTVIFCDGGFFNVTPRPGADQADFARRLKAPVLLIAGRFDWIFLDAGRILLSPQEGEKGSDDIN